EHLIGEYLRVDQGWHDYPVRMVLYSVHPAYLTRGGVCMTSTFRAWCPDRITGASPPPISDGL
ncbi:MAG: hypothetical protein HUU17_00005, partial [Chthonomonadales bacterium]|nr:hypothetical protein [Chthonomonadales bacterium]